MALAMPGNDMPQEFFRWQMAEKFGWTLEYIDNLSMADLREYMQVMDGRAKAHK